MEISASVSLLFQGKTNQYSQNDSELVYINIVEDWFKGPRLMTYQGRIIWTGMYGPRYVWHLSAQILTLIGNRVGIRILVSGYVFPRFVKAHHILKFKINKAFVIGSAIPQIQTIVGLIAAVAIMQFTYTFPPIMRFGYDVITDAMAADAPYVPGQGARGRVDTWRDWSRWKRVSISAMNDAL
jgi:hypothetical protein